MTGIEIKKALDTYAWEVAYYRERMGNAALSSAKRREARKAYEKAKAMLAAKRAEFGVR